MGRKRAKYSEEIKEMVRQRYPHCRNLDEKRELAKELGMGSLHKLYNLASRLGVTRTHSDDDMNIGIDEVVSGEPIRAKIAETVFTEADDQYLTNHFGNTKIQAIARQRNFSEPSLLWRARKLGLRKPIPMWRVGHVCTWLNMSEDEFFAERGLIIMQTPESSEGQHKLVSTTTLARWCKENAEFLAQRGADEFFLLEIEETMQQIMALDNVWEGCKYLSADHLCQNPASRTYGLYCTNSAMQEAGADPKCEVRFLPLLRRPQDPSNNR